MKKIGIALDEWKMPIFERHLKQAGYSFENSGLLTTGTFCAVCRAHFPVGEDGEFTWDGTTEKVGT